LGLPTITYSVNRKSLDYPNATSKNKFSLTTKERPLLDLNVVIPLKLKGIFAAPTAPPLPPSLLLKVLQCRSVVL